MFIIKQSISIIIITLVCLIPPLQAQQSDLFLSNMTVTTVETYNATNSITAGPNFTIADSGQVTFGTPTVNLVGDFVIENGGQFIIINDIVDAVETLGDPVVPAGFVLYQNYPNPFNPTTSIRFHIPELSFITLRVYDVLGKEIVTLVNEEIPAGEYEVEFSTKGGSASVGDAYNLSSGIYFYLLRAGDFIETKKMVLLR